MFHKSHLLFWVAALTIQAGAGVLPVSSAAPPQTESRATRTETALSRLAEIDWEHWDSINDLLADVHLKTGIPALAAVYVKDGKIVDQATVGAEKAEQIQASAA